MLNNYLVIFKLVQRLIKKLLGTYYLSKNKLQNKQMTLFFFTLCKKKIKELILDNTSYRNL